VQISISTDIPQVGTLHQAVPQC